MEYSLIITDWADELLDNIIFHLLYRLKNQQAASHLLSNVEKIYEFLKETPYQFQECQDKYLKKKGYREVPLPDMRYIIIYSIKGTNVYILGIFHELENYSSKL